MNNILTVNMVSESDISVQGHGVHTAYDEMASALEARSDVNLIRGDFGRQTPCDVVHIHTIGPHVWRKLFQRGPAKVISAHVVPDSFVGSIILAKYWLPLARIYMRWIYNRADKVLAVSGTVAKALEHELHVPRAKIETFYNTVDMSRYAVDEAKREAARKKLGLIPDDFIVLGNGQVQPRKRLDVFVAMAKALPDVKFIWVGGIPFKQLGADYQEMHHLMTNTPPNMHITGVIPHDEVLTYLAAADVFCLPAVQENHPMCVLEAAGAGLPIVLRDIPEYYDTFADDALKVKTDEEFVAAIRSLRNTTTRAEWCAHSAKIAARFDSHAAAERLVAIYRGILD